MKTADVFHFAAVAWERAVFHHDTTGEVESYHRATLTERRKHSTDHGFYQCVEDALNELTPEQLTALVLFLHATQKRPELNS